MTALRDDQCIHLFETQTTCYLSKYKRSYDPNYFQHKATDVVNSKKFEKELCKEHFLRCGAISPS